jgi:hypothetical protein
MLLVEKEKTRTRQNINSITPETRSWTRNLEACLPIKGNLHIPNFFSWINLSGFNYSKITPHGHTGFDFGAYLTQDSRIMIGLLPETQLRAVADGIIMEIILHKDLYYDYYDTIRIRHGGSDGYLVSEYMHIVPDPSLKEGVEVKKSQPIGIIYVDIDRGEGIRLPHLHLTLYNRFDRFFYGESFSGSFANPGVLNPFIYRYTAIPQGSVTFELKEFPGVKPESNYPGKILYDNLIHYQ